MQLIYSVFRRRGRATSRVCEKNIFELYPNTVTRVSAVEEIVRNMAILSFVAKFVYL